jgi:hypothetical protein
MILDASRDYDDTTTRVGEWWNEIGGEGPKPYETASWTFTIVELGSEEVDP